MIASDTRAPTAESDTNPPPNRRKTEYKYTRIYSIYLQSIFSIRAKDVPKRGAEGVRASLLGRCGAPAGRRSAGRRLAGAYFRGGLRMDFRTQQKHSKPRRGPWSELGSHIKSQRGPLETSEPLELDEPQIKRQWAPRAAGGHKSRVNGPL